jgi:hypothetical protein
MQPRFVLPLLAALAFAAPAALAQDAPPPPPAGQGAGGPWHPFDKAEMHKHFVEICQDAYPKAVGKLAYLEAKLQLTDAQKPLFDRWRDSLLSIVKTRTAKCGEARLPLSEDPVAHLKAQEERLKTHLANIEAQLPAFEAFAGSLSDAQKHILAEVHRHEMGERREHGFGHFGGPRFFSTHHDGQGPGEPPPPPPAQ